ncbi:MAG: DUF2238 domain-containing protein [Gammaproteobacteria bacterium]
MSDKDKINHRNAIKNIYILAVFSIIFLCMEVLALRIDSHYRYDILICLVLLGGIYKFKQTLQLYWGHYFLFSLFLLIHCMGMYQYYEKYPLGIEYDYWVHAFFGLISSLMILRWFFLSDYNFSMLASLVGTLIVVLGLSAAHELYEFAGAMLLGEGEGVLFIGAGDIDQWDTQKDMLNNLIGGVIGLSLSLAKNNKKLV